MLIPQPERDALQRLSDELERPLVALEQRVTALGEALRDRDAERIESEASALHRALLGAVDRFGRAARLGPIPAPLRRRLMTAGAHVAAQREVLARATASLDRAMDVLLPAVAAPGVYASDGAAERASQTGQTSA